MQSECQLEFNVAGDKLKACINTTSVTFEDAKLPKFVLYRSRHSFTSRLRAASLRPLRCPNDGHFSPSILQTYAKAIDEYRRDAVRKLEKMRAGHAPWRNDSPTSINGVKFGEE
jgi:hypothetical protein